MNRTEAITFDAEKAVEVLEKYPKLHNFICAGTISLKATRDLLGIDRYACYELYLQMLEAGMIYGSGSNMYRASPSMRNFMQNGTQE